MQEHSKASQKPLESALLTLFAHKRKCADVTSLSIDTVAQRAPARFPCDVTNTISSLSFVCVIVTVDFNGGGELTV